MNERKRQRDRDGKPHKQTGVIAFKAKELHKTCSRLLYKYTDRRTDRQKDRQTDGQTDRQTKTDQDKPKQTKTDQDGQTDSLMRDINST